MSIKFSMNSQRYRGIGYHGNKQNNIDKFIDSRSFDKSISPDDWLGVGIYFFEDDLRQAVDWCTRARRYSNWSVIEALIETEKVIDLTNSTENYNKFIEVLKTIREKEDVLIKLKKWYEMEYDVKVKDDFLNPLIFDMMYEYDPYDLVRHTFKVRGRRDEPTTNIRPMQVQLCVKNEDCIIDYEEVEEYGL